MEKVSVSTCLLSLPFSLSHSLPVFPWLGRPSILLLIKARKLRKLSCVVPRRRECPCPSSPPAPGGLRHCVSLGQESFPEQNPIKHKNEINCDIFQLAAKIVEPKQQQKQRQERWARWQHVSCGSNPFPPPRGTHPPLHPSRLLSRQMPAPRCLSVLGAGAQARLEG